MNKLKIKTKALRAALATVGLAIRPDNVIPALQSVHCTINEGGLQIIGNDGELMVMQQLEAETEGGTGTAFLMPFTFLSKLVALVTDDTIGLHTMSGKCKVITDTDVYEFKCPKVASYPEPWEFPSASTWQLPDVAGTEAYSALLAASHLTRKPDSDSNKAIMSWIRIEVAEKTGKIIATDGSLGIHTEALAHGWIGPDTQVYLPVRAVRALKGMAACRMGFDGKKLGIAFGEGNTVVTVVQPEGKYPAYSAMMPDVQPNFSMPKEPLMAALEKCCLTDSHFGEATFVLRAGGAPQLQACDVPLGINITTDLGTEVRENIGEVTVYGRKLLAMLRQVSGPTVQMSFQGANRPVIIGCPEQPGYLGLINTFFKTKTQ